MKKWFLVAFLSLMPALASALTLVEGKDYTVLANPTVAPAKGQIEVAEFFWYGCPHCYALEPAIEAWQKTKASGATKVSVTHFRTREGQELDNISPRRYFCTQCHVPQTDAKPLVENTFQRARGLQ